MIIYSNLLLNAWTLSFSTPVRWFPSKACSVTLRSVSWFEMSVAKNFGSMLLRNLWTLRGRMLPFQNCTLGLGVFQNIFRNANIQSRVTFDWSRIDHLDLKSRFKAFFKISPLLTSSSYQQRFKGDSLTCKGLRLWLDLRRLLLMVEIEGVELCCVLRLSRPVLKPACTHSGAVSCPTSCSGARCVERASFSLGL